MKANDIMTREVFTVAADDSLSDAAHIMCERDVGCVPVVDPQGAVVGIITDRDICKAAYHREQALRDIGVKDAMSKNVISVRPGDDMSRVEDLMQVNKIRRVPVIDDDGILEGIIAIADIACSTDDEAEVGVVVEAVSQPHANVAAQQSAPAHT